MLLVDFMDTEICFAIDHRTSECGFVAVALLLRQENPISTSIIHFMGSPKPWDLGAEMLHPYADIWNEATAVAGLAFHKLRKYFQLYSWKRAWRIRRQYSVWKPIFR